MCSFLRGLSKSHDATSRALGSPQDAQRSLQNHFENIQRISDGTTLPQLLVELERGLDRAASIDLILAELRSGSRHLLSSVYPYMKALVFLCFAFTYFAPMAGSSPCRVEGEQKLFPQNVYSTLP